MEEQVPPKLTPQSPAFVVPVPFAQEKPEFHEAEEPVMPDAKTQRFSALDPDYDAVPTYPLRTSYKDFHSQLRTSSRVVVFEPSPDDPYHPGSMPIYQTSTFVQPCASEYGAYDYTRSGNPTRTALERQVAMLENAHAAFSFSSGMAALNAVTRLLKNGDTIIIGSDIYGGMHRLVNKITAMNGITVKMVETWDLSALSAALEADPNVALVHVETPSNPLMRITDIRAVSNVCRAKKILLSVDSTMMTPMLQQPINHGADIVVHSMTKFFGGHSDTMGGVVCVGDEELAKKIAFFQNAEGSGLAPFDCWLFLRGIKTLAVRVFAAQTNADSIARFLLRHNAVTNVFYAGLEPNREEMLNNSQLARDYKTHMGQSKGGGSVISFTTNSVEISRRVIDNLRIFKLTVSFGSCNSLCEMPATLSHASIPVNERTLPDDLIRLSIGIEDVNDLLEDLQRAFAMALDTNVPSVAPSPALTPALASAAAGGSQTKLKPAPSTMHTSDRTKPDLPKQQVPKKNRFVQSPDAEEQAQNTEVARLRSQIEAHEKNKTMALAFISGALLASSAALLFIRFQVGSDRK
ncbi:cystathionine beta-lyase [Batrachochytrium salamandrivorans]|nr:cystathionine beta-lyase [Batrachochytrium salamandrivorans]KAH9262345.1 cystathionine beta-lyase [Batrachochytrium salamandrivorans]